MDNGISVNTPKPEVISSKPDMAAYINVSLSIRPIRLHIIEKIIIYPPSFITFWTPDKMQLSIEKPVAFNLLSV